MGLEREKNHLISPNYQIFIISDHLTNVVSGVFNSARGIKSENIITYYSYGNRWKMHVKAEANYISVDFSTIYVMIYEQSISLMITYSNMNLTVTFVQLTTGFTE